MLSLKERVEWLESELPPNPARFQVHSALPFAILCYDPDEEWELRRQATLLASRLQNRGRSVVTVSLAEILWQAIDEAEPDGRERIFAKERAEGFAAAQAQVTRYLSDDPRAPSHRGFLFLPDLLVRRLAALDPSRHIAFLTRAAALAPHIYQVSQLLDQMQGRAVVPTVLFYPGHKEGANDLVFMNLPGRDAHGTYRVRIYA